MSTPEQEQKIDNPSMADILSSIRHVIAKGEGQNTEGEPSSSSQDDVLELTEPLEEPSSTEYSSDYSQDLLDHLSTLHLSSPALRDSLLSKSSENTASSAFQTLSRAVELKQAKDEVQGVGGKTVDELVKEIMKPFIRDWLNQHLPLIVERLVSKEIDRLTAQAHSASSSPMAGTAPKPSSLSS